MLTKPKFVFWTTRACRCGSSVCQKEDQENKAALPSFLCADTWSVRVQTSLSNQMLLGQTCFQRITHLHSGCFLTLGHLLCFYSPWMIATVEWTQNLLYNSWYPLLLLSCCGWDIPVKPDLQWTDLMNAFGSNIELLVSKYIMKNHFTTANCLIWNWIWLKFKVLPSSRKVIDFASRELLQWASAFPLMLDKMWSSSTKVALKGSFSLFKTIYFIAQPIISGWEYI